MMAKLQLVAYFPTDQETKYFLTENIRWIKDLDKEKGYVLTPPLASDDAVALYKSLTDKSMRNQWLLNIVPKRYKHLVRLRASGLGFPGFPVRLNQVPFQQSSLSMKEQESLISNINQILAGRIVADQQIDVLLRKQGWWPSEIFRALELGYHKKIYRFFPGVIKSAWGVHRCARCESVVTQVKPCWRCGRAECGYCDTCDGLGEIQGCSRLWVAAQTQESSYPRRDVALKLGYSLTAAQSKASQALVRFLADDHQEILVWAACGAGKTEVSFEAIRTVLGFGGEVLFAIPRRDVVRELAERLKKCFPDTNIATHYGGQPWESQGQLVIATTHQALRFYRRFSLVVLDESDAFPYHGNEMLRFAIQRGKKHEAKIIEMTATPINPQRNKITIPARYHGYPLPEPSFLKMTLPSWEKLPNEPLPLDILTILIETSAPWLVFVPTIKASKQVGKYFEKHLQVPVCFCFATDPERDLKKEGISNGKYQVMVTTSVMERGITIPNIQVMVLYCDHPIFDANSLIQMAGRVGRHQEFPNGQVLLIGDRMTQAVKTGIGRIKYLNKQAKAQDLLRVKP